MSAIPAFEIGVWNAWIFMLYPFLMILLAGKFKKCEDPGQTEIDALSKNEKGIFNSAWLVFFCIDILYLPAIKTGDDMVLYRSPDYSN
jgi:hypothetical protein